MYDAGSLEAVLAAAKQAGIVCIADEVMTGFGRTGHLFASEYVTEKPDIICLSKGLTGGTMALGVTACTEEIYQAYVQDDQLKTFFHGHSFTANPLACTAALASLDLLEKAECRQQIQFIAAQHTAFTASLLAYTQIKNVRTLGTLLAFEIDRGKDEYLNNAGQFITSQSLEHGVYLRPLGNTVYIMPPYCITAAELQKVYSTIEQLLQAIEKR
jgi:adenosylmethionine-8-amino-7-oxononanoate aminotransferase